MNWWKKRSTFERWMIVVGLSVVGVVAVGNGSDNRPDTGTGSTVVQINEPATVYEPAERVTTTTDAPYSGLPVHNAMIGIMVEQFGTFSDSERAMLCGNAALFFGSYYEGYASEAASLGDMALTEAELRSAFEMALIRVCS